MRYIAGFLTLGFVLLLDGCIPSLHPLYTDKDLVFDAAILGEWVRDDPDSKETLTFTRGEKTEFKLTQVEDSGKKTVYIAHLVRLNGKLFMDVGPDPSAECDCLCGPVHMFFFVSQDERKLRISGLASDWIEKFLRKDPRALSHEFVGKDLWLTAPPKQLQSFLLQHLNTKGAFAEPFDYLRKQ